MKQIATKTQSILLSKKGMKELKKSIAKLERQRQRSINALRDLDKTDTHDLRLLRVERLSALEMIDSELLDKKQLLVKAKLFPRKRDAIRVAIGSVVELIDMKGRIFRYRLVDSVEANPSDGRISIMSPLGQSLLGKKIKETIEWGNDIRSGKMQLVKIM